MKPIYKILIIVIVIIIIGVVVYFLWQKFAETPEEFRQVMIDKNGVTSTTTETKTENEVTVKKISDAPVFDFALIPETKEVFYFTNEGFVFLARSEKDEEIVKQLVSALNSIEPSPDFKKALVAFGDPLAPQWGIFDFIDKVWRPLPSDIVNAAWGKDNTILIGTRKNGDALNLVTMDISKTPPATQILIKDFRFKDVQFVFKMPQSLFIVEKSSGNYESRVLELNTDPKKLTLTLVREGRAGSVLNFSSDRNTIFQFAAPDEFRVLNSNFEEQTPVFFITLPSKCSSPSLAKTIYCFVPRDFPPELRDLLLPDDYFQNRFYTVDDLYSIDLETEDISAILGENDISFPIDAKNPQYADGKLYLVNKYDNYLYEISNF